MRILISFIFGVIVGLLWFPVSKLTGWKLWSIECWLYVIIPNIFFNFFINK